MNGGGIIDEIEGSHIVQTSDMVFVLMGKQNGIEPAHPLAQQLLAEVRPGINHQTQSLPLDHRRGAQPLIVRIGRATHGALAPDDGYALRCSGSKQGNFHTTKIEK